MSKPTVAIVGASRDRGKFGNKSVRAHAQAGYEVFPVNPKADEIEGWKAYASLGDIPKDRLDRISVYVPPEVGVSLLDEMKAAAAGEVFFNPGSESPELLDRARKTDLAARAECSIVNLGLSPSQFSDE